MNIEKRDMSRVTSKQVEEWVNGVAAEKQRVVLDDLFDFAGLQLSGASNHSTVIDTKATSLLGWAGATAAFLLVGHETWTRAANQAVSMLSIGAASCAIVAALCAGMALLARKWPVPSELDWFRHDLFADPVRLRTFHVCSLLDTYREHDDINRDKAKWLVWSQNALVIAMTCVGVLAIFQLWSTMPS